MKKFILTLSLVIASVASFAQTINVDNLTRDQIAQVNQTISEMKSSPSGVSSKVRGEVSAWVDLGKGIGQATVAGAREVGIAANEFASTPLGK